MGKRVSSQKVDGSSSSASVIGAELVNDLDESHDEMQACL